MPKYLLVRQKEIWQFSRERSTEENLIHLLTVMACCRQAKMDDLSLELYTATLRSLDLRAVQVALANLSERRREEGQTTLPSLGDIMAEYEACREVWPAFSRGFDTVDTDPIWEDTPIPEPEPKRLK